MNEYYSGYTEDEHEQFLNFVYKEVYIGPLTFKPGKIIRTMDYKAFKVSFYAVKQGVWRCGRCGAEYKFKSEARDCCLLDNSPKLGGL